MKAQAKRLLIGGGTMGGIALVLIFIGLLAVEFVPKSAWLQPLTLYCALLAGAGFLMLPVCFFILGAGTCCYAIARIYPNAEKLLLREFYIFPHQRF
ncbi:MAG: hypothetical protein LV481_07310 [Methylacidiphilales bacterium]|nr:hypothetical protein [Candidatus Methylacidiphilales bacterium]